MRMWHEARKQERKIRGMLVDYRKRAERRQDFYERIKADPTQFLQIHGRKCRIHLDPAIAAAGDGAAIIVPWLGQPDNLIDRFDVRAHLDHIPPVPRAKDVEDLTQEERLCNYERYRILAQNDFLGLTEEKYLHQLYLEEQFGVNAQIEQEKPSTKKKLLAATQGAAIGYSYEENDSSSSTPFIVLNTGAAPVSSAAKTQQPASGQQQEEEEEEETDSDLDMDVSIDVAKIDTAQAHELNTFGRNYGMTSNDFYSFLTKDADEAESLRMAREEEQEKIMLSGRKSRRERRAQRERRLTGRPLSPPSYAAKEEAPADNKENESDSRSSSPENSGKITYITSFGGEDELQPHSKISINFSKPSNSLAVEAGMTGMNMTYAEKVKQNLEKLKHMNEMANAKSRCETPRKPMQYLRGRNSSSRSRSRSRGRYRYGKSRSRSRGYRRSFRKSRSDSRHRKHFSRSRSTSAAYRRRGRPSKKTSSESSSSSSSPASPSPKRVKKSECISRLIRSTRSRSRSISQQKFVQRSKTKSPQKDLKRKSTSIERNLFEKSEVRAVTSPILQAEPLPEPPTSAEPLPEIVVKRYYGRKREDISSSSEDELEDGVENEKDDELSVSEKSLSVPFTSIGQGSQTNVMGKPSASTSGKFNSFENKQSNSLASAGKINLREKMKRKMQILLNKQYKADKKAEIERTERQIQQQQEREDEMRELALKLRRRQREIRHKYGTPESSDDNSSTKSSDNEQDVAQPEIVHKHTIVKPPQLISTQTNNTLQSKVAVIEAPPQLRTAGNVIQKSNYAKSVAAKVSSLPSQRRRSKDRSPAAVRSRRSPSTSRGGFRDYNRRSRSQSRDRRDYRRRSRDYERDRSRERGDRSRRNKNRSASKNRSRERIKRRSRSRSRERNRRCDGERKSNRSPTLKTKRLVDY